MTPGDNPLELRPVRRVPRHEQPEDERTISVPARYLADNDTADLLAAGGTVEHEQWLPADRNRFVLRWLGVGTVLAAILLVVLEILAPWKG